MSDGDTHNLHALAQHIATASLAVDAAAAFLERGDLARLRQCLDAAAEALAGGAGWIGAKRAEEAAQEAPRR